MRSEEKEESIEMYPNTQVKWWCNERRKCIRGKIGASGSTRRIEFAYSPKWDTNNPRQQTNLQANLNERINMRIYFLSPRQSPNFPSIYSLSLSLSHSLCSYSQLKMLSFVFSPAQNIQLFLLELSLSLSLSLSLLSFVISFALSLVNVALVIWMWKFI